MMGFEPRTMGLQVQGPTNELQCTSSLDDDILTINLKKVLEKDWEPPGIALIQPSIQLLWANLSIYSLVRNKLSLSFGKYFLPLWFFASLGKCYSFI